LPGGQQANSSEVRCVIYVIVMCSGAVIYLLWGEGRNRAPGLREGAVKILALLIIRDRKAVLYVTGVICRAAGPSDGFVGTVVGCIGAQLQLPLYQYITVRYMSRSKHTMLHGA
jgi:hypothetical protein